jgi:DNA-binding NarL/FixJ family response regulator
VGAEPRSELIHVAVVEDEPLVLDLLRIALAQQAGLAVAGAFGSAAAALEEIPRLAPQVAVLDIDLGRGLSGIQLGLRLREQLPSLGIVLLSNHWVPRFLATLPPPLMAGWCYLLKKSVADVATLGRTIAGAAAGLVVLDPHVVAGREPKSGGALARLPRRQREVLRLIAQGFSNPAIAERLAIADGTVENQVTQIYQELGLGAGQPEFNPRVLAVLLYLRESRLQLDADTTAGDRHP